MMKSENIFWGIAIAAGAYLLLGGNSLLPTRASQATAQTFPAAGGHIMPNGQWMAGDMKGMGCGMGDGGGCGCGGGQR